jgi:23S rRNA (guanosine2251-2'-O)-methyltransferase
MHAVAAALANPRRKIERLSLTENAEMRLRAVLDARQIVAERVSPRDLDRRLGGEAVHQGALLECQPLAEPSLAILAQQASQRPLIVLDQITDPHNVGAILRSAAAFGAAGLIMPRRHSPPLEGALAKSASGALELVATALVGNLAHALSELKQQQFAIIGLDANATELVEEIAWPPRSALVLGAEGKGLRQLTRQSCDLLCRIATAGALESLNVSNAAAVALHVSAMRRLGLA